ncbi:hypothetical protein JHW43_002451 [Diplocarpon mali]|nr:hypothetical protein JHW43_002451 [Diplocarpon mali]
MSTWHVSPRAGRDWTAVALPRLAGCKLRATPGAEAEGVRSAGTPLQITIAWHTSVRRLRSKSTANSCKTPPRATAPPPPPATPSTSYQLSPSTPGVLPVMYDMICPTALPPTPPTRVARHPESAGLQARTENGFDEPSATC